MSIEAAFVRTQLFGRSVIVEEHVEGGDYRVLVIGHEVVAASRRVPPGVIGDGHSDVRQLVDAIRADARCGDGHENMLTKIRLDEAAAEELDRQALDLDFVSPSGQMVKMRGNGSLSNGGTAQDVTSGLPTKPSRCHYGRGVLGPSSPRPRCVNAGFLGRAGKAD